VGLRPIGSHEKPAAGEQRTNGRRTKGGFFIAPGFDTACQTIVCYRTIHTDSLKINDCSPGDLELE
jgi:hypothetical protein